VKCWNHIADPRERVEVRARGAIRHGGRAADPRGAEPRHSQADAARLGDEAPDRWAECACDEADGAFAAAGTRTLAGSAGRRGQQDVEASTR
jgi:hypothetical protein